MPLGRSVAYKICASALELAKTLISKEVPMSFQRGVGFLIRWQLEVKKKRAMTKGQWQ